MEQDQRPTIKKAILQWKKRLAAVRKQDGEQVSTSSVECWSRLLTDE